MEEGSRSDQDILSLSPHSEWHETRSDCTDLDVADLMVIDEVGPDDNDATAGASPGALGPAEGYSNMATGMLPMSSSCQHHNEPESGETNEGKSEDCRAIVPSKSRLRKCPVCGLMSREKTRKHKDTSAMVLVWLNCMLGLWPARSTSVFLSPTSHRGASTRMSI
ncbi:unnamed protein product [Mytilus coruscus]|uniref:Uncharacterized protein n=1 Tax=Mytilus coruscus TaxID=42192 RepID=A0A6J8B2U5_MYTCO|nr:unnamed protein product [Mytilus coruscus]